MRELDAFSAIFMTISLRKATVVKQNYANRRAALCIDATPATLAAQFI